MDAGCDVNEVEAAGNTPLHSAAYEGWKEGVELLLQLGAKVNASNNAGDTPWHWAMNMGWIELAAVLEAVSHTQLHLLRCLFNKLLGSKQLRELKRACCDRCHAMGNDFVKKSSWRVPVVAKTSPCVRTAAELYAPLQTTGKCGTATDGCRLLCRAAAAPAAAEWSWQEEG